MSSNNQKKTVSYLFKGGPGIYGKGAKQTTEDDFIEMRTDAPIHSLPYMPSISFYHRKRKPFLNYNRLLNLLFIICFCTIITTKFFIDHIFITVHEKNLEDLISKLCFAFIGSYIFYTIVTKTTDKIKKREAYAVICGLIDSIIIHGNNVKKWLLIGANKDSQTNIDSLSKEDFKTLCSQVDINLVPQDYQKNIGNMIITDGVTRIKFFTDKIFTYMPFLESELIHQTNKILNSKFSTFIIVIPHKQTPNLKEYSSELQEFFAFIKQLENYNNKLKKKYLKKKYEKKQL
ncbi:hypothetical protein MH928_07520 [Flavobacterium sp. WW92]|uniref:hypothetical protein n=1 Tax=unclassified Flavobacterium TaxID=196869 RepID=UPI002223EF14|nr:MULTISPECIES: hypothetical protein [unclassified Flavobacterium]WDO14536.1 hypothetical protein MH928_07520 [Flavobacterium sp. WW92]